MLSECSKEWHWPVWVQGDKSEVLRPGDILSLGSGLGLVEAS